MSEDQNSGPGRQGQPNDPNASSFNWKGLTLLTLAFVLIGAALLFQREDQGKDDISYPVFLQRLDEGKIILEDVKKPLEAVWDPSTGEQYIRGHYTDESKMVSAQGLPVNKFKCYVALELEHKDLMARIHAKKPGFAFSINSTRRLPGGFSCICCRSSLCWWSFS